MTRLHRKTNNTRNMLNKIGASIGWFAVLGQLVLIILNRQADVLETLMRFFSFFTILTNILVACYFTSQLVNLKIFKFLKQPAALTAITAFILVVGIVYQVILRFVWEPTGWQFVIDELLHTFIPLYVLMYWIMYAKRTSLSVYQLVPWLLYPLGYAAFIVVRGHFSGFYPYPFVDIDKIGYSKALINFLIIFAFMVLLMGLLFLIQRFFNTHPSKNY